MAGGQQITVGQGSLTAVRPGQQVDLFQGSAAVSVDLALAGLGITSAQGFVASDAVTASEALTGSASTGAAGTAAGSAFVGLKSRKVGGGSASRSLTGSPSTLSTGTAVKAVAVLLGGSGIAASFGDFGRQRASILSGSAAAPAQGTITGSGGTGTGVVWQFSDGATLSTGANSTTGLATGIPSGAVVQVSPDLLPGQTLQVSGTLLEMVGDSAVPTVNGDSPNSAIDYISARDIYIEVMDSPLAVANHIRAGSIIGTYGLGQAQKIWYAVQDLAQDGDIFEISPGAVAAGLSLGVDVPSSYLSKAVLKVNKSITLRGMTNRGRWSLLPSTFDSVDAATFNGILILSPADIAGTGWDTTPTTEGRRKTIVISDFSFNNWGQNGDDSAVKLRSPTEVTDWTQIHNSVTFRNFKVWKPPFEQSASGFAGAAENLVFEDGHIYDTGDGVGAAAGNDHNFYITCRNLTMRGVRASRTRSAEDPFNPTNKLDGHILKMSVHNADIQGCVFDTTGYGDNSKTIQSKSGGNLTVKGCLFVMGAYAQDVRGGISFEKETANYGGDWFYGAAGHSLLIEKNVFIAHRADSSPALVYFYPAAHEREVTGITSCVIRDNIGMAQSASTAWVANPPAVYTGTWAANGNAAETYSASESPFDNRLLKLYTRAAGTLAATGGTVATHRFVWPHGYIARSDAYKGFA
jgi:hypothetical protein